MGHLGAQDTCRSSDRTLGSPRSCDNMIQHGLNHVGSRKTVGTPPSQRGVLDMPQFWLKRVSIVLSSSIHPQLPKKAAGAYESCVVGHRRPEAQPGLRFLWRLGDRRVHGIRNRVKQMAKFKHMRGRRCRRLHLTNPSHNEFVQAVLGCSFLLVIKCCLHWQNINEERVGNRHTHTHTRGGRDQLKEKREREKCDERHLHQ